MFSKKILKKLQRGNESEKRYAYSINTIRANSFQQFAKKLKEDLDKDVSEIIYDIKKFIPPSKNALCPCGSEKLYKRCCFGHSLEDTYLVYQKRELTEKEIAQQESQQNDFQHQDLNFEVNPSVADKEPPKDLCPICSENIKSYAQTIWQERFCINGHIWHHCPVHKTILIGPPDHSKGEKECTCI